MAGGIEGTVGTDEHVVAEGDFGFVKYHEVGIGKEMVANLYVVTVVAEERSYDVEVVSRLP